MIFLYLVHITSQNRARLSKNYSKQNTTIRAMISVDSIRICFGKKWAIEKSEFGFVNLLKTAPNQEKCIEDKEPVVNLSFLSVALLIHYSLSLLRRTPMGRGRDSDKITT